MLQSRWYRAFEVAGNFVVLDLLWVLGCLPIVTAFPATAAMFAVTREWVEDREAGVLRPFVSSFKDNFRQALGIGVLWTFVAMVLAADLFFVINSGLNPLSIAVYVVSLFAAVAFVAATVFLFPVMVTFTAPWRFIVRNSLLLGLGQLKTTATCMVLVGAAVALAVVSPITLAVTGSFTAYVVYRLCHRCFARLERDQPG